MDAYPKILAGVQQRQADAWQAQTEEWAATVKADKEIGGDKLTANLGVAQRAPRHLRHAGAERVS